MAGLDQVLTRRPRRRLPLPSQRAPSPVSSRLMVRAASRSSSPRRRRAVSRSSSAATSAGEPLRRPPGWTTRTSSPSKYSTQVPRSVRAEVVGRPGRVPASRMMASSLELEGVLSPCGYHRQPPPSLSPRPDGDQVADPSDTRQAADNPLGLTLLIFPFDLAAKGDPSLGDGHLELLDRQERVPFQRSRGRGGDVGVGALGGAR